MATRAQVNSTLSNILKPVFRLQDHSLANKTILDYLDQEIVGVKDLVNDVDFSNYYTKQQVNVLISGFTNDSIAVDPGTFSIYSDTLDAEWNPFGLALGNYAGYEADNSAFSNFLGNYAGAGAINAQYSNFLGDHAGFQATGATGSNFFGDNAGYQAYAAEHANFFGSNAGTKADYAFGSNFFGNYAGADSVYASSSNFLGEYAGADAPYATWSNFIGYQAGWGATMASDSIFLGSYAGKGAGQAANAVFIGPEVGREDLISSGYTDNGNNDWSVLIGKRLRTGGFKNSVLLGGGTTYSTNTRDNQFALSPNIINARFRGVDYIFPASQAAEAGYVLTNDGTGGLFWTAQTGSSGEGGTVTSVGLAVGSSGTDVNVSGSPVTSAGNITLNIPNASATARGLVTTGAQTIAGNKTFSSLSGSGSRMVVADASGLLSTQTIPNNGTVTSVGITSSDLTVGSSPVTTSGNISLSLPNVNSNIGTYNNVTVNAKGQVTAASNVAYLTSNQDISFSASGDVSGSSTGATTLNPALTIGNNVVSYAKMQDMTANRLLGRLSTAGDPQELTGTQVTTLVDTFTASLKGVVPASGGGTANYLRADGTWSPISSGSVTSVGLTVGNSGTDVNVSNSPITSSGNLVLNIPDASATARGLVTTGDQTFVGIKRFNGFAFLNIGFSTFNGDQANLQVPSGSGVGSTTNAQLLIGGASSVSSRILMRGSTSASLSANQAYSSMVVGVQGVTEASSGVHPLMSQLAIRPLSVTNNAGSITTDAATLYIEGAATGITPTSGNYALWSRAGSNRFGGNLVLDALAGTGTRMVVADANGQLSTQAIPSGGGGGGTVSSVGITSTDLTVGSSPIVTSGNITLSLPSINSNVGTFNNLTVNAKGQVTAASNVSYLTSNQSISFSSTGDVFGSATGNNSLTPIFSIQNNAVTYAKMQDVTANRILGRLTSDGDTQELTGSQVLGLLDTFSSSARGVVPASGGGTINYLRADGTWVAPPSSTGTVSSVGLTVGSSGTDVNVSGSPITSSGTITLHIPNASATARGLITTAAQTIAGAKTLSSLAGTGTRMVVADANGLLSTQTIPNNGTVTSVGITSTDITVGGSPITSSGNISLTLPNVNSSVGTFNNVTVNAKGQVTAATNVTYLTANQNINFAPNPGGDVVGNDNSINNLTPTLVIKNNAVTYSQMQDMTANRLLGRLTTNGDPTELTPTQVTAMLDSFTPTANGLVPASGGGIYNFLRADGAWVTPTGLGVTINNNADDYLLTGSGTANTINGESSLRFDGNNLLVGGATNNGRISIKAANNTSNPSDNVLYVENSSGSQMLMMKNTGLMVVNNQVGFATGSESTPGISFHNDSDTGFYTSQGGNSNTISVAVGGDEKFRFNSVGDFLAMGDISGFSTSLSSDTRLKKNIQPLETSLDKVMQLNPVKYEWVEEIGREGEEAGLIAQEVEIIFPELVKDKHNLAMDGEYKTVDYAKLTVYLLQALKEQQEQINELKERLK